MHEQPALQERWALSLRITVWETVKFETERRETFVLIFFTFSIPSLIAFFLFLEISSKFNNLNKGSKRGG